MTAIHDIGILRHPQRELDVLLDQDKADDLASLAQRSAISSITPTHTPSVGSSSISSFGRPEQRAADRQHLALAARQRGGRLSEALAKLGKEIEHLVDARACPSG